MPETASQKPLYQLDPERAIHMTVKKPGGSVYLSITRGKKAGRAYSLEPGDELVGFPDPKGEVMLVMRRKSLLNPEMKARSEKIKQVLGNIGVNYELVSNFEDKLGYLIASGIAKDWHRPLIPLKKTGKTRHASRRKP